MEERDNKNNDVLQGVFPVDMNACSFTRSILGAKFYKCKQKKSRIGKDGLPYCEKHLPRHFVNKFDASGNPVTFYRKYYIGRNQPCPCGSGLKHKKCCGGVR
jgi:hypothetical protein